MTPLGRRVSELLDGHLSPGETERCWDHVHSCPQCRDLVEHEGWVKTRLAQLSFGATSVPDRLKESLIGGTVLLPPAFPVANRATSVRARGLIAIGGGAAGVCVVGVLALGLSGGAGVDPRPPVTDLSRQIAPSATREATPAPRRQPVTPLREKMAR